MNIYLKLLLAFLICYSAAGIGGYATANSIEGWYSTINKPSFNPPNWIFGPVWSLLYTFMAITLWKIWSLPSSELQRTALFWFALQLALNTLWSFLFFYFESPLFALIEILILWVAILFTIIKFYQLVPWTGILLVPYILWVSFATFLNASIWWLNK
jgi:benzodiazapine receptor